MSNLAVTTGRKKQRTKETKVPVASRSDRHRSGSLSGPSVSTAVVDDANAVASTDVPYVCTGRFGVDFVQLCRRAHLAYVPNVVARPHRPAPPSVVDDKKKSADGKYRNGHNGPNNVDIRQRACATTIACRNVMGVTLC